MSRFAWSQLRFRAGRALALLAGMLVAAAAFTCLRPPPARRRFAPSARCPRTSVPPMTSWSARGARSSLESATGTVQPDFVSGVYGGITMAQYHQIQQIAGVQVAAPIAVVGYGFMTAVFPVRLPAADVARPGRQLYRFATTWVSANGTARIGQPTSYVHVTPDRRNGWKVVPTFASCERH